MSGDLAPRTDRDILVAASRALGRIDELGVRGITNLSVNDIEAMSLALVILGLVAIPRQQLVPPQQLVIARMSTGTPEPESQPS